MSCVHLNKVGVNLKGAVNVRIDRKTIFGNPVSLQGNRTRDQACDEYEWHFKKMMKDSPLFRGQLMHFVDILRSGKDINLQCHCHPLRCHGETIRKWLENEKGA